MVGEEEGVDLTDIHRPVLVDPPLALHVQPLISPGVVGQQPLGVIEIDLDFSGSQTYYRESLVLKIQTCSSSKDLLPHYRQRPATEFLRENVAVYYIKILIQFYYRETGKVVGSNLYFRARCSSPTHLLEIFSLSLNKSPNKICSFPSLDLETSIKGLCSGRKKFT